MDRLHRLTSARDFGLTSRAGTRASSGPIAVSVLRTDDAHAPRFGFTTPRAIGSAVRRNRAKRLMREAARALPISAGVDVVVTAKPGAATSSFQEIELHLSTALRKAGVAC